MFYSVVVDRGGRRLSNKKAGNDFEDQFAELAGSKGFWAHRMTANVDGQPADVIICKNNIPILVDCKDCKNNVFKLSRIEENQELAMIKWLEKGNKYALFALKIENDVWLIPFMILMNYKKAGIKQLNKTRILEEGYSLEELEETIMRGR